MSTPGPRVPGPETATDPDAQTRIERCEECDDDVLLLSNGQCEDGHQVAASGDAIPNDEQ